MNIKINTGISKFLLAFSIVQDILYNPQFWKLIESYSKFDNTEITPKELSKLLQEATHEIIISDWEPTFYQASTKYRNTTALTDKKGNIKLNILKENRDLEKIVGTLIHEIVHAVDKLEPNMKFTHKGQNRRGNENTAPYVIGEIAIKIFRETHA